MSTIETHALTLDLEEVAAELASLQATLELELKSAEAERNDLNNIQHSLEIIARDNVSVQRLLQLGLTVVTTSPGETIEDAANRILREQDVARRDELDLQNDYQPAPIQQTQAERETLAQKMTPNILPIVTAAAPVLLAQEVDSVFDIDDVIEHVTSVVKQQERMLAGIKGPQAETARAKLAMMKRTQQATFEYRRRYNTIAATSLNHAIEKITGTPEARLDTAPTAQYLPQNRG